MPALQFEHILAELRKKIYHPLYFLSGEEPYFIDVISDFIEENVLSDAEKEFNQTVVYGRETDTQSVISIAKRFPMMANYQVVVVKEAQLLEKVEQLATYLENPVDSTILVVNYKYKKLDKRTKLYNALKKRGVFYESSRIYENQVQDWIEKYVKDKGFSIDPKASVMLAGFLGTDLGRIVNEVNKLIINLEGRREIGTSLVETYTGISKDYNVFELQNALGSKHRYKAYSIAAHFAANPKDNPVIKTIILLSAFFTKVLLYHSLKDKSDRAAAAALSVSPFFIRDYKKAAENYPFGKTETIISLLRQYDMKAKGVDNPSTSDGELLKELVFRIVEDVA